MKLSVLFLITAIVSFIYGVAFIVVPEWSLGLYGVTPDTVGQFLARYLGASFLGFTALTYLARNSAASDARRALVLGMFIATLLGLIVGVWDAFAGMANNLVWLTVAIYLLLALGYGYFGFVKTGE